MESKKTYRADLENKRSIFLLIGFVFSFGVVLAAFSYREEVKPADDFGNVIALQAEDEMIPITRQEEAKPLPPPPAPVLEVLPVVEDNAEIKEEFELPTTEADASTTIETIPTIEEEEDEVIDETAIYSVVDDMPEFPGGERALSRWIADHIIYPKSAVDKNIQGKVYVQFIVERDGSIHDPNVIKSIDPALDQEALRVIKSLPRWKPGLQQGRPVRVSYMVPISFQFK